jgi:hypothetical protein
MRADQSLTVEASEFLLAALEQANDAVVIIDGDDRVRPPGEGKKKPAL